MVSCNLTSTLLFAKVALTIIDGSLLASPIAFHELVSSLEYLTLTHPDISLVINMVAFNIHLSS